MASRVLDAINNKGNHEVGNLNSIDIDLVPYGAECDGDIDNFLLVEMFYDDSDDYKTKCKVLSDATLKSFLIASVEERFLGTSPQAPYVEELVDFYNGDGELARLVYLNKGLRFETSAFEKNTGLTTIVKGNVAHFDVATKKYIISEVGSEHADYATAYTKFEVVYYEDDGSYTLCEKELVRLEVIS